MERTYIISWWWEGALNGLGGGRDGMWICHYAMIMAAPGVLVGASGCHFDSLGTPAALVASSVISAAQMGALGFVRSAPVESRINRSFSYLDAIYIYIYMYIYIYIYIYMHIYIYIYLLCFVVFCLCGGCGAAKTKTQQEEQTGFTKDPTKSRSRS